MNSVCKYTGTNTSQAIITDIYTPSGAHVSRNYSIYLKMPTAWKLSYTSKFPIPIGTKFLAKIVKQGVESFLSFEVLENTKTETGLYTVNCKSRGLYYNTTPPVPYQ